jgi:rRNA-processing protein FCF1
MKRIILDTNALMAVAEFGLDIFAALQESCDFLYEVCVLDGSLRELEKIVAEQRGKFSRGAELGLVLVKAKNVKILPSVGDVDDVLVAYSKKGDYVLTQDRELKARLQKPYLTIRQKRRVLMVG